MKTRAFVAVVMAFGVSAAMADMTITGKYSYGYSASHDSFGKEASGFGVDTDAMRLTFKATEDWGGGQAIAAQMGFDGVTRAAANPTNATPSVVGGDGHLTYTNQAFGRIEAGLEKDSDIFTKMAYADADLIYFDGKLNQIRNSHDYVSYAVPVGPMLFKFKHSEGSAGIGEGVGSQGADSTVGQSTHDFIVAYFTNTFKVGAGYRKYTNPDEVGGIFDGNGLTRKDLYHIEAGYDFGAAKLGVGYDQVNASWGVSQDNTLLGVSVPSGRWLFGAAWERSSVWGVIDAPNSAVAGNASVAGVASVMTSTSGLGGLKSIVNQAQGSASGVSMSALYAFSKRTSMTLRYARWTRSAYEQLEAMGSALQTASSAADIQAALAQMGYKQDQTETDVVLTHTF